MKSVHHIIFIILFALVTEGAFSQSTADTLVSLLDNRWYLTEIDSLNGDSVTISPAAGDSVKFLHIVNTDSITRLIYHNCTVADSTKYKIVYDTSLTYQRIWMIPETPDTTGYIISEVTDSSFVLSSDTLNTVQYYYQTIDTFTLHPFPVVTIKYLERLELALRSGCCKTVCLLQMWAQ